MDEIYIVTICFEDFESTTLVDAGFFSSEKEAEEVKEKWERFFEENRKKIFDIPRFNGEFESDEAEDEHYSRLAKYEPLHSYSGISIEKRRFGVDEFAANSESRSKEMQAMIMSWERDYRISKIVD
jgi:uncharacterized protein (DUF1697 family)